MAAIQVRPQEVPMAGWVEVADGFTIAHLSDLHLRRWSGYVQHLQDLIAHLPCDLLLITGDLGHRPADYERTAELLRRLFGRVRVPLGIYGVLGNHDDLRLADETLPLTILRNELRLIHAGGFEFYLGGIEQTDAGRGTLTGAFGMLPDDAPLVLMAHYPSTVFELPSAGGALLLAGHTHGGQVCLPGLGCLWTNDALPRALARGLHAVGGNWLHVSAGIGVSSPFRWRLFCPPEITLLRLKRRVEVPRDSVSAARKQDALAA